MTKQKEREVKRNAQRIVVGCYDYFNELGENRNKKDIHGEHIITLPLNLSLGPSSLHSYSMHYHSVVVVTRSGSPNQRDHQTIF